MTRMTCTRFLGLHALVTGGASGIGAATARRLAGEGASVIIADIDVESATLVAKEIDASVIRLDIACPHAVKVALSELGPIDVLVNNAGAATTEWFVDSDPATWTQSLAVNLHGAMACTHAVLPGMYDRRRGAIVNVASAAGITGIAGGALYSATKAGVIGFTKAIAREGARYDVRCNAVAPGPIDTPLLESTPLKQVMIDATVLGRAGHPDEVAAAIAFLASDDASYVTGHTLAVGGGVTMQ